MFENSSFSQGLADFCMAQEVRQKYALDHFDGLRPPPRPPSPWPSEDFPSSLARAPLGGLTGSPRGGIPKVFLVSPRPTYSRGIILIHSGWPELGPPI